MLKWFAFISLPHFVAFYNYGVTVWNYVATADIILRNLSYQQRF